MSTLHVDHVNGPSSWGDDVTEVIEHHACIKCGADVERRLDPYTGRAMDEVGICGDGHNSQPHDELEADN